MLTISPGPCIHSEALECELVEPTPEAQQSIEREKPVSHSLKSPITLAQYQCYHPFQPIVRESGLGENVEVNTIPISPPPLGFATEVSSSLEGHNIRRRITPSTTIIAEVSKPTPVFPKTRPLPLKPTTIIAKLPKPAVTGREETRAEMLERSFQEIIKGNRKSSLERLGLPPPTAAKFQSNGVKKRIQDRTQDWAEGTLESKQKRGSAISLF